MLESKIQPAGLKSPTVISLQLAGWLVFICLWLPLCRGCGGASNKIPMDFLQPISLADGGGLFSNFLLIGSYCNGIIIAFSLCITTWFLGERLWRVFFFTQFSLTAVTSVVVVVLVIATSPNSKSLLESTLGLIPALLALLIWVGLPIRRNELQMAWARLQHAWTIGALFFVHFTLLFQGTVLYGYWLTMIGLVGLAIAVELARYRMQHDLWDVSKPVVRLQFSIRSILLWTAFFPIVFSYYRSIGPISDWLFK